MSVETATFTTGCFVGGGYSHVQCLGIGWLSDCSRGQVTIRVAPARKRRGRAAISNLDGGRKAERECRAATLQTESDVRGRLDRR